ncbi:helix-turn-helix domain-containing protein [Streptomyces sp. NBC_01537]|uniref:ArsR/SmtB family transcription factor n=1 Tax=Streptomyces sp. NBC_01537 TaxID=2903896 RepID=UPI00386DC544
MNHSLLEQSLAITRHGSSTGEAVVYRIHFTAEDLARTRVAESPRPMLELANAVRVLQDRNQPVRYDVWRQRSFTQLPSEARLALDLIPLRGWTPDFLARVQPGSPQDLLEQIRSTSRKEIRQTLAALAEHQTLPSWTRRLGDDPLVLQQLADSMHLLHTTVMAPYWPHVVTDLAADRAARIRELLHGGVERLLTGLYPPRIRWTPPTEVAMASGMQGDLRLEGRGLLLVPSLFGSESPVIDPDAEPQPFLTYPANLGAALTPLTPFSAEPAAANAPEALTALLGRTRAAVLHAIATHPGCNTAELAGVLGIGASGASQHATVLRQAGLVTTLRHRNSAVHTPTSTGLSLLMLHS